ncbi:MAG: hypothetical protein ACXAB2_09445, partial [Candidatus Hodarchaeales archaeon]
MMTLQKLAIPEYSMELRWDNTKIYLYDQIQTKVLQQLSISNIESIRKHENSYNQFLVKHHGWTGEYLLTLELVRQKTVLSTKGGYILDFFMKTNDHGFYFGLYEIGEFKLSSSGRIQLLKTLEIDYLGPGIVTPDNLIYTSIRNNETLDGPHNDFLVLIDWNQDSPCVIWKEEKRFPITSLYSHENCLFIGSRDGSFEIWNVTEKRVEVRSKLFKQYVKFAPGLTNLLACGYSGEIALLNFQGDVLWLSSISESSIHAITEDSRGIHVVDEAGEYFLIDPKSGAVLSSDLWNKRIFSDLVIARDWMIGAGVDGFHGRSLKNHSVEFSSVL